MRLYRSRTDAYEAEIWTVDDEHGIAGYEEVTGWRFWLAWLNRPRFSVLGILVGAVIVALFRSIIEVMA